MLSAACLTLPLSRSATLVRTRSPSSLPRRRRNPQYHSKTLAASWRAPNIRDVTNHRPAARCGSGSSDDRRSRRHVRRPRPFAAVRAGAPRALRHSRGRKVRRPPRAATSSPPSTPSSLPASQTSPSPAASRWIRRKRSSAQPRAGSASEPRRLQPMHLSATASGERSDSR